MTNPTSTRHLSAGRRWAGLALSLLSAPILLPCAAAADDASPNRVASARAAPRKLEPARGHYARLAARSPAPASSGAKTDAMRFQHERAHVEDTLSARPQYVTVDPSAFQLPPLPANSSAQTRAELDYLLRLQERRTPEDVHDGLALADWGYSIHARPGDRDWELVRGNLFRVGHSIGTWFNPDSLPLTAELLGKVWRDARFYVWSLKYKYARVRPYVLEPRLKNLQETDWAAFPSGHASYAYMAAYFYQDLAPEFADVFVKDALDIAHSREVIGVHYPSDSEAGRAFARQFINLLLQSEQFQRDLAQVREEWRRGREQTE
ncbi:MAG: phosphatase PAP2 family protein [Myxococcaceae bacterium]|nr:phosphatase PAP2 family protein [Myxococcaceae bacterium]